MRRSPARAGSGTHLSMRQSLITSPGGGGESSVMRHEIRTACAEGERDSGEKSGRPRSNCLPVVTLPPADVALQAPVVCADAAGDACSARRSNIRDFISLCQSQPLCVRTPQGLPAAPEEGIPGISLMGANDRRHLHGLVVADFQR